MKAIAVNNRYEIDEQGNVWDTKSERFLKWTREPYPRVTLEGKQYYVHVLVAEAYLPKPETDEFLELDHKDDNPRNPQVSNLQWVTRA